MTVRRSRLSADKLPVDTSGHAAQGAPPAAPEAVPAKAARVFRLPTSPQPAAPDSRPVPAVPGRARRAAAERRPGPVTQVLKALPRPATAPLAPDLQRLSADLARVGPVLAEIERAQAFCFLDDRHDADWQRLLQQAAVLSLELKRRAP